MLDFYRYRSDVMVSFLKLPDNGALDAPADLRIIVQPLVGWLWLGGAVMAIGTILAAVPSRLSRRPTDPVSAPIGGGDAGRPRHRDDEPVSTASGPASGDERSHDESEPVGVP